MPAKDQQGKAPTGLRMIVQKRMMDDVLHNTMSKSMCLRPFSPRWRFRPSSLQIRVSLMR